MISHHKNKLRPCSVIDGKIAWAMVFPPMEFFADAAKNYSSFILPISISVD
jgi:hypothetical protein